MRERKKRKRELGDLDLEEIFKFLSALSSSQDAPGVQGYSPGVGVLLRYRGAFLT